jgi:hypothetical protein
MLRIAALLIVVLLAFTAVTSAQEPYDDERTPEGWAWKQIRNDQIVDFNTREGCNGGLSIHHRKPDGTHRAGEFIRNS